ncbi:MAG: hypothetical protein ACTSXH_05735 [Promethearchaeota archaeon]
MLGAPPRTTFDVMDELEEHYNALKLPKNMENIRLNFKSTPIFFDLFYQFLISKNNNFIPKIPYYL